MYATTKQIIVSHYQRQQQQQAGSVRLQQHKEQHHQKQRVKYLFLATTTTTITNETQNNQTYILTLQHQFHTIVHSSPQNNSGSVHQTNLSTVMDYPTESATHNYPIGIILQWIGELLKKVSQFYVVLNTNYELQVTKYEVRDTPKKQTPNKSQIG